MTQTFLRVKRRRTDEPLPYIRLQALNRPGELPLQLSSKKRSISTRGGKDDAGHLGPSLCTDREGEELSSLVPASVLWKRLEQDLHEGGQSGGRVVDALLETGDDVEGRQTKRPKLTLLFDTSEYRNTLGFVSSVSTSRSGKPKVGLKVLDPLTRLVDDSLQQVHAGARPIAAHFRLITSDPVLASSQNPKRWLLWSHSSGGNLLHACALWNDVEMAGDLLQIPNLVGPLCETLDGDGRTPYEVAQLSGHDSVCEVLEAFGGDTANFVYDMFCLEQEDGTALPDEDEDAPMTVELTDGVAYWTPAGELMLETNDKVSAYLDDDDGDVDSNCEEYDANDYPDEEEEDVFWGDDDERYDSVAGDDDYEHACSLDQS